MLCTCTFDHLPVAASVCVGLCVDAHMCIGSRRNDGVNYESLGSVTEEWSITIYVEDCQRTAERRERSAHKLTFWFWRVRMCGWQELETERRKMARLRYSDPNPNLILVPAFDSFEHVSAWYFEIILHLLSLFLSFSMIQPWEVTVTMRHWIETEKWKPSLFYWQFYSSVGPEVPKFVGSVTLEIICAKFHPKISWTELV